MKRRRLLYWLAFLTMVAMVAMLLSSCAKPTRKPEAALDTPEHHAFTGYKLYDKSDYDGARREFVLAMQLDKNYSPAYVGLGL